MGVFLEARENRLFASWYHYRNNQSPRWWISIGDFPGQSTGYNQPWHEFTSGQTLTGEYKPATYSGQKGSLSLNFLNESQATMQWQGITYNLRRFVFIQEDRPGILNTGDSKYPTMLTRDGEAMVVRDNQDEATFYNDEGKGFWAKQEGDGLGARTTAFRGDNMVMTERVSSTRANVVVMEPGGGYTTHKNVSLGGRYSRGLGDRDILRSQVDGLSRIASSVGSIACLLDSVIDWDTAPEDLKIIASACDSLLLTETSQADSDDDFSTTPTFLGVGACNQVSGNSCSDTLAGDAETTGNQYDTYATVNSAAIEEAQEGMSKVVLSVCVINYDWGCTGASYTSTWYLYSDHTFDSAGGLYGTWSLSGSNFTLTYSNGTTYSGVLSGTSLTGTMVEAQDLGGDTGCWTGSLTEGTVSRAIQRPGNGVDTPWSCETCS